MLTNGSDGMYRGMLASSYGYTTRMEVWMAGERVDTFGDNGLPKTDGSLSATLQSRVARTLNLTVSSRLAPDDIEDPDYLLSPLNKEIRAFAVYNDGLFEFPVFRGRIQTLSYKSNGNLSLSCSDRAQDILDDDFVSPRNSDLNARLATQYYDLIRDSLADATFRAVDTFYTVMPKLTWASDRGQACDDVANAGQAYWYALAEGAFTLQVVPWTLLKDPVATFVNGKGGALVDFEISANRQDVYNRVAVAGERADGSAAVYGSADDNNPASPTYINGPFGRRAYIAPVQSATSAGQARAIASQYLRSSHSFKQTWTATIPHDASLELGDALLLEDKSGRSSVQVLSNFTLPMTASGSMSCQFRAQNPGAANVN